MMPQPTPNQKKRDRNEAVLWARKVLASPEEFVILDTETTGLGPSDEIVQIAIIDVTGQVLLDSLVQVHISIPRKATEIHGITKRKLKDAPLMADLYDQIRSTIENKIVVAYNAAFDGRLLQQSIGKITEHNKRFNGTFNCAMEAFSMFVGEWNHDKDNYRWHKLSGGDHSALGDCRATLKLIQTMAQADLLDVPKETKTEHVLRFCLEHPGQAVVLVILACILVMLILSALTHPIH